MVGARERGDVCDTIRRSVFISNFEVSIVTRVLGRIFGIGIPSELEYNMFI